MNKYLETKRIYLRELSTADEDQLFDLDSDSEVMKYLTHGKASTRDNIQKMIASVSTQLRQSNGKYGVWAAIEKESSEFIGWFHLFPPKDDSEHVQKLFLGYRLKRKHWGKGYASEVSKVLIEKAFSEYEASEVCAQSMKANTRSQKVMLNAGMTFSHEFTEKSFPQGSQEAVLFSIRNSSLKNG